MSDTVFCLFFLKKLRMWLPAHLLGFSQYFFNLFSFHQSVLGGKRVKDEKVGEA